ncbi:MAG: hypothetical protein ACYCSS_08180 [Sulfuriferula sp.]
MNTWKDPFGSNRLGLWLADRRDRKNQRISRIAARWGWLTPLGERGKVVWVMAGADRNSVRLAIELVRAIRDKRLDIRLILTFEQEYPDLLTLLDDCDKTGWGLAPCDHPRALTRALQRLAPFGIVVVNAQPRPHLTGLLAQRDRVLVVNPPQTVDFSCERIYNDPANSNSGGADMQAILAQAQIDPNFKSLINQGNERHLWWLHGATAEMSAALAEQLLAQTPDDVLFVSGIRPLKDSLAISAWDRNPISGGRIVWIDDEKWLPAISAAVTATHFAQIDPVIIWQAMAGGAAISCAIYEELPKTELRSAITACNNPLPLWQSYRDNPILTRQQGDSARRLFWQERRLAETESQELVTRVFEW